MTEPQPWVSTRKFTGALLPNLLFLLANSILRAATNATLSLGSLKPFVDDIEAYVKAFGKFPKFAVAYVPAHPPPAFWGYYCGRCRWWLEPQSCQVVEGLIRFSGWCSIWVPKAEDEARPFGWPAWYMRDLPRLLQDSPQVLQNLPRGLLS